MKDKIFFAVLSEKYVLIIMYFRKVSAHVYKGCHELKLFTTPIFKFSECKRNILCDDLEACCEYNIFFQIGQTFS